MNVDSENPSGTALYIVSYEVGSAYNHTATVVISLVTVVLVSSLTTPIFGCFDRFLSHESWRHIYSSDMHV